METEAGRMLREVFGYDGFRAGQEAVVSRILSGCPALAVFPTGGGKSLCYQVPALLLDGMTLVVSPLLALMKDQVDRLMELGVSAARIDSTMGDEEISETMRMIQEGRVKLLYVAPERLANEAFLKCLRGVKIPLLAIDEAHCLSEWGHNFRPDYLKLPKLVRRLGKPTVLALTATATRVVARDLRKRFRIKVCDEIRLPFSRVNLALSFCKATPKTRDVMLLDRLVTHGTPAVVYVTRQETAERVAGFLSRGGIHARAYHAGLRSVARAEIQHSFMIGETPVVVATIAFGMGIDKGDIRQVIHYNLPKSIEGYVQEIGRAGRDGMPARCEVLACGEDLTTLESFVHADAVRPATMRALLDRLLRQGRVIDVSLRELSENCDMRISVVTTVLAYLEADGVLRPKGGYHAQIRLWLVRKPGDILAGRGKSEQTLLRRLLDVATIDRSWHVIRISEAVEACKVSEAGVRRAAESLASSGDARLRYSHKRFRYDLLEECPDAHALAERYAARFAERDETQLARIGMVAALAAKRGCLVAAVARHFGETDTRPCGQCGPCQGQQAFVIKPPAARAIGNEEWDQVRALTQNAHPALRSSTQLARFLCGMTSPATLRARLTRHDAFGLLADLPYRDVLPMCQAILRE